MKRIKLFSPLFLLVLFVFLSESCSKEKRLERTLHKSDGKWTINTVTWQKVVQTSSGQTITMGTSSDAGTFIFDKDGSGEYNFTINGDNYNQTFSWSVSDETISITKVSQNYDFTTGDVVQLSVAFSGSKSGKNKIVLEGSETLQFTSGSSVTQEVFTGTFEMTRN